ncbi:MAG: hypothetical protein PHR35_19055 [Kiritimatiellae bacterium]|nr:hypothetical protein [Kiritimatiellia bacterium]
MHFDEIPQWARLRRRYEAFWRREVIDDLPIAHIQNPNPDRPPAEPWMLAEGPEKYLDPRKFYRLSRWRRTAWNWHTDLFRYLSPAYGPNVFAGFCGAQPAFGADTVWHEPLIRSLDEADRFRFDEDNAYWRAHLETVDYFAEQCQGRLLLGVTDFGGPTDWISQAMGTEAFLIATLEDPDRMRDFALRLARECNRAYDLVYPRVMRYNDGCVNWMPVWGDRRLVTAQDDMAINFSPEMYREVFLPALRETIGHSPRSVLHWHDGCAHHLDALLGIPELAVIQFGHDPSSPPFRRQLPCMQRIQASGKLLFISCVEAEDVEFFLRNLDPRGLMMIVNTADDAASARMAEDMRRWTRQRLA